MILNQMMQLDIAVVLGEEKWKLHYSLTFPFKISPFAMKHYSSQKFILRK